MRLRDSQSWISKTLEGTYNTAPAGGSNYIFVPTTNPFFALPSVEKVSDAGRIGRNAASHLCNTYWSHFQMQIQDDVETGVPAHIFARALGGSVTDTLASPGVYDHTFAMLNPQIGVNLPSFGTAVQLGDASFLFHGCRVDKLKISQQNNDRVVYEADVIGSGKFTNPHGLTSLPGLAPVPCMDGFRTNVSYTDDSSTQIDLGSIGKLIEWSVELNNNLKQNRRRVGDPIQTAGSGAAAHVRSLPLGQDRSIAIQLKMDYVDLTEWNTFIANKQYTNLKFKISGPLIDGTNRHEFEIIIPQFTFETVQPDDDDGDAAITVNIVAFEDSVTKGPITGRVRNDQATLV